MAKLKFGAWIPTYAWSGGKSDPNNVRRTEITTADAA
jgi:hypothetical protein